MILRFCSGSLTPSSRERKSSPHRHGSTECCNGRERVKRPRLARAHQPVIDEDAGQLVADGFVYQNRGDGGIHAAGKAAHHLSPARPVFGSLDHVGPEQLMFHSGLIAAMPRTKFLSIAAARRMRHFRMELHAIESARLVRDHRIGRVLARVATTVKTCGSRGNFVANGSSTPARASDSARQAFHQRRFMRTLMSARPNSWWWPAPPRRPAAPTWSSRHSRCPGPARRPRTHRLRGARACHR